jgi:hypothetical protein
MQMVFVMMSTTMKPASLMEEIAVVVILIQIIAQYVNALKEEEGVVALLAQRVGLVMGVVMISTTI